MQGEKELGIMKEVLRIRLGQMIINEKYKKEEFKVPIHLALGHEAIAVAVNSIIEEKDKLILSHRNIHYNLTKTNLKQEIDEYLLKKEGLAKGQLGSMNLANEDKGIIYTSSILGNNLPVAVGVALSKKTKNEKGIVIVVTGDGAIEEGTFYESLLFAKTNHLPLLVIIENNGWSLATRIHERRYNFNLKKFTESLGARYEKLNSNDVYEYSEKLKELKDYSLSNNIPICIEVELTTLGCRISKNDENPTGKFVNYHAGAASAVNIDNGFLIDNSNKDPIFVLQKYFEKNILEDLSKILLQKLNEEIK